MVIRAQIGNSPNVGLLVLGLRLISGVLLLGHVVDAALIFLPVGINHGSSISSTGVTLSLHVPLFLAVATYYVGVTGPIAADRGSVHGGGGVAAGVLGAGRIVSADSGDPVDFLHANVIPGNVGGLGRGQTGLDSGNFLGSSVIIVNGLQLVGQLHAVLKGVLTGLYDLVADGILDASQEELVLEEEGHVLDALGLGLVHGGASQTDGGHGGGFVIHEAVVTWTRHPKSFIDSFGICFRSAKLAQIVLAEYLGS
jgi:hypothetical protein